MLASSCPRKRIEPADGWVMPKSRRASVVLPLPLSPAMAVMVGFSSLMISEISSTATMRRLLRRLSPKTLVTFNASKSCIRRGSHCFTSYAVGRMWTFAVVLFPFIVFRTYAVGVWGRQAAPEYLIFPALAGDFVARQCRKSKILG